MLQSVLFYIVFFIFLSVFIVVIDFVLFGYMIIDYRYYKQKEKISIYLCLNFFCFRIYISNKNKKVHDIVGIIFEYLKCINKYYYKERDKKRVFRKISEKHINKNNRWHKKQRRGMFISVDFSLADAYMVSVLYGALNVLGMLIKCYFEKKNRNFDFEINPYFVNNQNSINIDCIIKIKAVHIIFIMKRFI
jgi:hypothetical protein